MAKGARPDTWMPMFWGDYARDTGHLNALGHGAYLMLIKHYWCSCEELPDDDDTLWRVACCDSKREWLKLRPKIERFFVQRDGKWSHKRIDAEIERAWTNFEVRSKAGQEGNAKRYGKDTEPIANGADCDRNARVPRSQNARASAPASYPAREEFKNLLSGLSSSLRHPRRKGPDFSDPKVRKQAWEQKIINELNATLPSEKAQQIVAAYMNDEQWARDRFEVVDKAIKARLPAETP